jgi:hypothetical protein
MANRIQLRRGTAAEWTAANPVLGDGEPGVEKDTGKVKYGNGVAAWAALPYASAGPQGPAGVASDTSVKDLITTPGSQTATALSATILDKVATDAANPSGVIPAKIQELDTQPATSLAAAFPNLYRKIATHNDVTGTPVVIASVGTSVGVGASTVDPATQAPGAVFTTKLATAVNRLGNMTFTHQNSAVNGSVENELLTQYNAAKAAAGVPHVAIAIPNMNGGMPFHYHTGQTFNGIYDGLKAFIEAAQSDGVDVVLTTTPHPHTEDTPWTAPASWSYPQASPLPMIPGAGMAESVKSVKSPSGVMVPASKRHLRANEVVRRIAAEYGLVVLDAERYHFDAVAKYGEDALHNTADYAHPNLFGHQQTYGKAIDALVRSLTAPVVQANSPRGAVSFTRRRGQNGTNATTTLTTDPQLTFYAGANTVWEVDAELFYIAASAQDIRLAWELPAGVTGRHAALGLATTATATSGDVVTWSTAIANSLTLGGNNSEAWGRVRAIIVVGATAGTIGLQYANDVAGNTATMLAHSMLRATRIA